MPIDQFHEISACSSTLKWRSIQRTLYERVAAHGCRDAGLSESSWHGPGRPLSSLREAFLRAVLLLTLQLQPLNKLG